MKLIVVGAGRGVGRQVAEQAAGLGHEVSAFVRDGSAFDSNGNGIRVIVGDATNPRDVTTAIQRQDAVLCTLGAPTRAATTLYSAAAGNLVTAMTAQGLSRLIFLSNFGVLREWSHHPLTASLVAIARLALKGTLSDHRAALGALQASTLSWTAVRPLALTDGPQTGRYRVSEKSLPPGGTRISRADVASFMLGQLESDRFIRSAPAIAY